MRTAAIAIVWTLAGCTHHRSVTVTVAPNDTAFDQVLIAVADDVGSLLPPGDVVFDPRVSAGGELTDTRSKSEVTALATRFHARISNKDSIFSCVGSVPEACSLKDATSVVMIDTPTRAADSAKVVVEIWSRGGPSWQPIVLSTVVYRMVKSKAGNWIVASRRVSVT